MSRKNGYLTVLTLALVIFVAAPSGCHVEVQFDPLNSQTPLPFPTNVFYQEGKVNFSGDLSNNFFVDFPEAFNNCIQILKLEICMPDLDFSSSVPPAALNQNDGFSTTGRIVIGLDVPRGLKIDPASLPSNPQSPQMNDSVLLATLTGDLVPAEIALDAFDQSLSRKRRKDRVEILYLEPFRPLEPSTTYIVVVKGGANGIKDSIGNPVVASDVFESVQAGDTPSGYEPFASEYVARIQPTLQSMGIAEEEVALAFSFTTRSEGSISKDLEEIRADLHRPLDPVLFLGTQICNPQELEPVDCEGDAPPTSDNDLCYCNLKQLEEIDLPEVAHENFDYKVGLFNARNYQDDNGHFGENPEVQNLHRISFLLTLPKNQGANVPIVIFQHPSSIRKERLLLLANQFAEYGFAMIGIDAVEHNFRNSQNKRNPTIFVDDLFTLFATLTDFHDVEDLERMRDNFRQTIVDLFHLVRVIDIEGQLADRVGVDSFSNLFYIGDSIGSFLGVPFVSLEPEIEAAAFWVVGGKFVEVPRESTDLGYEAGSFNAVFKLLAEVDDPIKVSNFLESITAGQVLMDLVEPSSLGPFLTRNALFFQSEPDGRVSHGSYADLARALNLPIVGNTIVELPGVENVPYPHQGEGVTQGLVQYDTITIPEESSEPVASDHNSLIRSVEAQCQAIEFFKSYQREGVSTIVEPTQGCQ